MARLFLMDADGTNVEKLTSGDLECAAPSWSPDGDLIAFSGFDESFSIFTARPGGTGLEQLTGAGLGDHEPAWSPSGNKIVFRGKRDDVSGLFTVGRSDPFVERLTRSTPKPGVGVDGSPYWAPQP